MEKSKLAVTSRDMAIIELARKSDHKTLAVWAADCAERVLPYFEARHSGDERVRAAIEAARGWVHEVITMPDARKAAFAAHTAAREVEDGAQAHAARAAGHAAATAHVASHAIHAATYATTAVRDVAGGDVQAVEKERAWQYEHLLDLSES